MSSVSSTARFGVSDVFFHGSGGPGGSPLTISCDALLPPVGGKTMTSNLSRSDGIFATCCVEMYVYGTPSDSSARRHHPSSCVRSQVWRMAMRGLALLASAQYARMKAVSALFVAGAGGV